MTITIKTQAELNASMLANISDDYEKSTGFLTGDLVKTNSIELGKVYTALGELVDMFNVDNIAGADLTKYVLQRKGIVRKVASYATASLTVAGTGTIAIGDLFATATNTRFAATEAVTIINNGTVAVQAVEAGTTGNVGANTIVSMPITIAGITSVTNAAASTGGYAEETDAALRTRYYIALQTPATSGNIYHYKQWALEVTGVGGVKPVPLWNGANTVKVVITNSSMLPADSALVASVQEYIDPDSEGLGKGEAPIGAYCTVVSATGLPINISCIVTLAIGYTEAEVVAAIEANVTVYLAGIAFVKDYVSYAKIGNVIIDTEGVADYADLLVNSGTSAVTIGNEDVAITGTVTIS